MLDGRLKRQIDPWLTAVGTRLAGAGMTADGMTLIGFALGLWSAVTIATGHLFAGLLLLLASRLADGLDGAVARASRPTDFGGFLDIVLDFAFYGAIPFAFVMLDPARNGVAGALLILSFYVNGASFLAFSALAAKRGLGSDARGPKSIYFTTGLAEASETLIVFVLACLFPSAFVWLAVIFAVICFYTALARILEARALFVEESEEALRDP